MKTERIALIDSGIGGISLLNELIVKMPTEKFLYLGDVKNAPYGNKSKAELLRITENNIKTLLRYPLKCVVFACNTLSVTVSAETSELLNVPLFGVYPPVEPIIKDERVKTGEKGKTDAYKENYLFCTVQTAERYKGIKGWKVIPLKDLAKDVEDNKFRLSQIDLKKHLKIGFQKVGVPFPEGDNFRADKVILGCTHYYFVKDQFIDHLKPRRLLSGNAFTAEKVKNYVDFIPKNTNGKENTVDFIGDNFKEIKRFYEKVGKYL